MTAANASSLNDGAAALVLMNAARYDILGDVFVVGVALLSKHQSFADPIPKTV